MKCDRHIRYTARFARLGQDLLKQSCMSLVNPSYATLKPNPDLFHVRKRMLSEGICQGLAHYWLHQRDPWNSDSAVAVVAGTASRSHAGGNCRRRGRRLQLQLLVNATRVSDFELQEKKYFWLKK